MPAAEGQLKLEHGVAPIAGEWEDLAERSGTEPFRRPDWIQAWWAAFGRGELQLATLRRADRLTAVLPLRRSGGRLLSTTNLHTPVYGPAAASVADERELLARLFELEARSIALDPLDIGDGTLDRACDAARAAGRLVARRPLVQSPYVALEGSFDDYWGRLSKNRRKGVGRCLRGLERQGHLSMEIHTGRERPLKGLLEEAFAVEASGWKGKQGTAIVSRPDTHRFYVDLARRAAYRGWLRLSFLRLDDRPVAFDFALEHGGSWYSLKAGYDAAMGRFGPGAVLLYRLLRHAFDQGLQQFELLGTVDDFKLGWTDRVRERGWARAFARSPSGRAEATVVRARELVRPAVRRARGLIRA